LKVSLNSIQQTNKQTSVVVNVYISEYFFQNWYGFDDMIYMYMKKIYMYIIAVLVSEKLEVSTENHSPGFWE
jgi:hypothetical protein